MYRFSNTKEGIYNILELIINHPMLFQTEIVFSEIWECCALVLPFRDFRILEIQSPKIMSTSEALLSFVNATIFWSYTLNLI